MRKILVFILLPFFLSVVDAKSCFDSDGGLDYYTAGYVKFDNTTYYDNCINEKVLIEGYCEGDKFNTTTYYCSFICENGSCATFKEIRKNYVPNEIIVKFKEEQIFLKTPTLKGNFIETGIASIDMLNSKYAITSMRKILSKPSPQAVSHGLNRVYLLRSGKNIDVLSAVEEYKKDPNVEYAYPNYIINITMFPTDPYFRYQWGLHNIGQMNGKNDADIDAPEAWNLETGNGEVIVAVIDSGVDYNHPDLADNIWTNPGEIPNNGVDDDGNGFVDDTHGYDFSTCYTYDPFGLLCLIYKSRDNDPMDDNGHGTHCAGIIGAIGNNTQGIAGINWNVKIMPIKFLNWQGLGTLADVIDAIDYSIKMGADISSNSYTFLTNALYLDIIEAEKDAGILHVHAAGNSGDSLDEENPEIFTAIRERNLTNIIFVAASNNKDKLATFSNYGQKTVHIAAPGVDILSTVPMGDCPLCNASGYKYLSGTSMAAPYVAGAAALIKAKFPNFNYADIKPKLICCRDFVPDMKESVYGKGILVSGGRLNVYKALNCFSLAVDSDGKNRSKVGICTEYRKVDDDLKEIIYQDECWRGGVKEFYRNGNSCESEIMDCPADYEDYDSDGPENFEEKGYCIDARGSGCDHGRCNFRNFTDHCEGNYAVDYYLVFDPIDLANHYKCLKTSFDCTRMGYRCFDGACKPLRGGGGCPILKVWNGSEFITIEKLNIHAPKDQDVTYTSHFSMKPKEDGKYELILKEAAYLFWDGSHIDLVKLIDQQGKECKLIKAIHSKLGDVTSLIKESDDERVETKPGERVELTFERCSGNEFTLEIEGYNPKPVMVMLALNYTNILLIISVVIALLLVLIVFKFFLRRI